MFYLTGNLSRLPSLYRLLEPTRRRSLVALHETDVRNEHAYYQCIAQVLAYRLSCSNSGSGGGSGGDSSLVPSPHFSDPFSACCDPLSWPAFAAAAANPIYVCGDSHTLSSAWSIVVLNGAPRLLVPRLVTGVKHWHLRQDSDFYPRANFLSALKSIPEGAEVIFIIGEIDCREGILLAVERDRYASVVEGMKHTVNIFASVLANIISTKRIKAYVHPVLPMLKETRPLVIAYNQVYQNAIATNKQLLLASGQGSSKSGGASRGAAHWLDFFNDLIVSAGSSSSSSSSSSDSEDQDVLLGLMSLKEGLIMDGTHITPGYVNNFLEAALNKCSSV